jgi:lysozyme
MRTSDKGINLIKASEGLRLDTYRCPAGKLTIGYGHMGSEAFGGNKITALEAEKLLVADLITVESTIESLVKVQLNQNQFDSLVSFVFNLGAMALRRSTLLRLLNSGDYTGAAAEFCKWNKSRNPITKKLVVLPGLIIRRCRETLLFMEDI